MFWKQDRATELLHSLKGIFSESCVGKGGSHGTWSCDGTERSVWLEKLITLSHAVEGDRINLSKNPFLTTTARLLNLLCAVYYWGQLVDVFAAPPKLWKTKQCEVMSLLLLMQTSCVALWEAWDLNSVCVSTQMGIMCAHTFPHSRYMSCKMSRTQWKYVKKKFFIYAFYLVTQNPI